ncbi:MAG: hypothetical protein DME42_04730 [Verrucomicrobia bacterium]|nr:MAG: hypothetical protein DME42_04730 [Verrucomicrobiota bacterium]
MKLSAAGVSGERRQLACGVRQLAEHDFVGKLPTNTGWQPALPRIPHATPIVRAHLLDFADSK